jgi:cellulose synthase/poly-beta-1,6-N-acetylglucosamine synthase-like glycosyltransferase
MISIIITAYKEEKTIGKAIESFLKNNIKEDYELLVFAPDKSTLDVVKSYSKKYKQVHAIKDDGKGKPAALNKAFKIAKGDILILSDGDVYIDKNSINYLLDKFQNEKIGAVSGHPVSINNKNTKLGYWSHLLTYIADLRRKKAIIIGKKFYCSGYFYAIRNGLVTSIPETTLSDDGLVSYMIHKQGYKIEYSPESKVYVKYPDNLTDWIKQKKRSAGGYNQIKNWTKKDMRSFSKESFGIFQVLQYPKNIKEFFWTFQLIFLRLYLWFLIFIDINLKKKDFEKIWVRIESTK